MDELKTIISKDGPDIMLFTEVIPKAQRNPVHEPLITISGYELYTKFMFTELNLGASGKRGVAIYVKNSMEKRGNYSGCRIRGSYLGRNQIER